MSVMSGSFMSSGFIVSSMSSRGEESAIPSGQEHSEPLSIEFLPSVSDDVADDLDAELLRQHLFGDRRRLIKPLLEPGGVIHEIVCQRGELAIPEARVWIAGPCWWP